MDTRSGAGDGEPGPYPETLAELYDVFRAGEDFDRWGEWVHGLVARWGAGGVRLLDVGCGTGLSSVALAARGFRVTGCDVAAAMLAVARRRPGPGGIEYLVADMRDLPAALRDYDVVTWLGDVANHLTAEADLAAALRASARALAPGGLLILDVNSLDTFTRAYRDTTVTERDDAVVIWRGETAGFAPNGLGAARITAFARDSSGGGWIRRDGAVRERHHDPATVRRLLGEAGLTALACFGLAGRELVEPADDDRHRKLVHVARRPA